MSDDGSKQRSAYRRIMDFIMSNENCKKQRADFPDFYKYIEANNSPGIHIELTASQLNESTRSQIGCYTARRDPPHFSGDEYHGHCTIKGGFEVAWTISGARRHANKFPAFIPNDAKLAVAKVLNVSPDILESFWINDNGESVLLLECKEASLGI
jgi:hypothetical protein